MNWHNASDLIERIGRLTPNQFVALCNDLLIHIAVFNGLDRSIMRTNLRINDADGGIDAQCIESPQIVGQIIPGHNVVYQYKSGNSEHSAADIAREDIRNKPRIIDALTAGKAMVYIASWDKDDSFQEDVVEAARNHNSIPDLSGKFIFIGSNMLSHLLDQFPALIEKHLSLQIGGLVSLDRWSAQPTFANDFQRDGELEQQMAELQMRIEAQGARVRIGGSAGDGKTRRILEVLRNSSLRPLVLYAEQEADLEPAFLKAMADTKDVQCVIVVDEVDDIQAELLQRRFNRMPSPGVRLVMIGVDGGDVFPDDIIKIQGLNKNLLAKTITSIVSIPDEEAEAIAAECEGSPKMAVLIAECIRAKPELFSNRQFLREPNVRRRLSRYLPIQGGTTEWKALSLVALFGRIGWTDPVDGESEILFESLSLNTIDARQCVARLHGQHGVVPLAGNYRYVSPSILADYLAGQQLKDWSRAPLLSFFQALTPAMQESFILRIRRMSHSLEENRQVVEEVVLGDQGPFRTLADLESSRGASLLRHLAAPLPYATLTALERIIRQATHEELLSANKTRREVVWAVQTLLWPERTFKRASSLLLKLAIAENETYGNNASNTWASTFQTQLGRTAAGWELRVQALREALENPEPAARLLGIKAINVAVRFGEAHRDGVPPKQFEGMPEREWSPATWSEWTDAYGAYLDLLEPFLSDMEDRIRQGALEALTLGVNGALQLPKSSHRTESPFEQWLRLANVVVSKSFDEREALRKAIERTVTYWGHQLKGEKGASLSQDVKGRWMSDLDALRTLSNSLEGEDFSSRFRAVTSRGAYEWREGDDENFDVALQRKTTALQNLAQEVVHTPALLESEWGWMLSFNQQNHWEVVNFFFQLGRYDAKQVFAAKIFDVVSTDPQVVAWHSAYHLAWAEQAQDKEYIDNYLLTLRGNAVSVELVWDLLYRAGYSASHIALLESMLEKQEVDARVIASLSYEPWGKNIPVHSARALVDKILFLPPATLNQCRGAVVVFLHNYLEQVPDGKQDLREVALRALSTAIENGIDEQRNFARPGQEDEYAWSKLALQYVLDFPIAISKLAAIVMAHELGHGSGDLYEVLQKAWDHGDKEELFRVVLGPYISSYADDYSSVNLWSRHQAMHGFPLEQAGTDFLVGWVREDANNRVYALASSIGAPSGDFSPLHAALLDVRYDDAAGAFSSAFMSGSWVGPMSGWVEEKINSAERWRQDQRPLVRKWAEETLLGLNQNLVSAHKREAEEAQYWKMLES